MINALMNHNSFLTIGYMVHFTRIIKDSGVFRGPFEYINMQIII